MQVLANNYFSMYKPFHKAAQNSETTDNLQASGKILQELHDELMD